MSNLFALCCVTNLIDRRQWLFEPMWTMSISTILNGNMKLKVCGCVNIYRLIFAMQLTTVNNGGHWPSAINIIIIIIIDNKRNVWRNISILYNAWWFTSLMCKYVQHIYIFYKNIYYANNTILTIYKNMNEILFFFILKLDSTLFEL